MELILQISRKPLRPTEVSMREDILPIHDITVTTVGSKPTKAYLVPGKKPLKIIDGPDGPTVTVPKLDVHAMVVFE